VARAWGYSRAAAVYMSDSSGKTCWPKYHV
jgi:hypothetical protein